MQHIERLEYQLKQQWSALHKIKDKEQFQQARAKALETYQTLKKQKQLIGLL